MPDGMTIVASARPQDVPTTNEAGTAQFLCPAASS